jgi:hypothetical protein
MLYEVFKIEKLLLFYETFGFTSKIVAYGFTGATRFAQGKLRWFSSN